MEKELREKTSAEIHFDPIHRLSYSVDASIYEIEPLGVVIPKTVEDLLKTVQISKQHGVPVVPRGAATGITGGCLGTGLIIDTSKYLNQIHEINIEEKYAICEPGVVQDVLNAALFPHGYRLGPDTSTGDRATLGGMVANNSAGARSLYYGTMVDHVQEVDIILSSGEVIHCKGLEQKQLEQKTLFQSTEGHIYREATRICDTYRKEIDAHIPKIPRLASGYQLAEFAKSHPFNLSKIITGSEGTLGIVTRIKLGISPLPKHPGLCIVHFNQMKEGMDAIEIMLKHHPLSLEMIDDKILQMGQSSPLMKNKLGWLSGMPRMVFVAEFQGETAEEVHTKLISFAQEMRSQGIGYAQVVLQDPPTMQSVWEVRKAGLGLLLSKRSYSRAIAFIEDISIAPALLPHFMEKFESYLKGIGKEAGIYGHVGPGCVHVRPYMDLRKKEELSLLKKIMQDVADLVLEHHGALSGEHGDGIIRTWLNPKMFGTKIYRAFQEIKAAFDPTNLMNPGKIVEGQPVLENLRLSPDTPIEKIETLLDFSREGGIELAADLCNGNGLCRKKTGVMCPSFQATNDEYATTRARAQALRGVIHGRLPIEEWTGEKLHDVLDLCLQCKGCKTECPSQVDMAKMKTEFLYQYQEKRGYPFRSRLIGHLGSFYDWGAKIPRITNFLSGLALTRWILKKLGFSPERPLPRLTSQRFSQWFKAYVQPEHLEKLIVLFNDTYNEFISPEIGQAAVKVLNACGYKVLVPEWTCCGRPLISKGMLKEAKKKAASVVQSLYPFAQQKIPIIGLEPSCILTFRDEFLDLRTGENEKIQALSQASLTFDEFMQKQILNKPLPFSCNNTPTTVYVHTHCHQKALIGSTPTLNVLQSISGLQVHEIPSGCCGMAGSFGYEEEHADLSLSIGELKLFPVIRNLPESTSIIADGFSCRSQIIHGTQRHSQHLVEFLAQIIQ